MQHDFMPGDMVICTNARGLMMADGSRPLIKDTMYIVEKTDYATIKLVGIPYMWLKQRFKLYRNGVIEAFIKDEISVAQFSHYLVNLQ